MVLEKTITKKILDYLNGLPDCYAIKTHGNRFTSGQPDITGCLRGRRFEIEVKRPGGKPTKLQAEMLERWRKAGAIAGVATSRAEARELLAELLEEVAAND